VIRTASMPALTARRSPSETACLRSTVTFLRHQR
jgi:hypothetical protein